MVPPGIAALQGHGPHHGYDSYVFVPTVGLHIAKTGQIELHTAMVTTEKDSVRDATSRAGQGVQRLAIAQVLLQGTA